MKTILLFVTDGVAWVDVQNYLRGLHKQQTVVIPLLSTRAQEAVRYGRRTNHNIVSIDNKVEDVDQFLQNLDMLRVCDKMVVYVNEDKLGRQQSRYRHLLMAAEKNGKGVLVHAYDKSGKRTVIQAGRPSPADE